MTQRATAVVSIRNRLGMHARPAMAFVDLASRFHSDIVVQRTDNPEPVDGKSIMQVMMLAATQGTELEIIAQGDDGDDACRQLKELIERGFDED
ncbi:MAG: HPr family phosphocarrier protein [Planctomycetota bacterium]|nr:HPr family phosphocarrier protein [Planctomycetota bacterium]